jgi:hypothetical protein
MVSIKNTGQSNYLPIINYNSLALSMSLPISSQAVLQNLSQPTLGLIDNDIDTNSQPGSILPTLSTIASCTPRQLHIVGAADVLGKNLISYSPSNELPPKFHNMVINGFNLMDVLSTIHSKLFIIDSKLGSLESRVSSIELKTNIRININAIAAPFNNYINYPPFVPGSIKPGRRKYDSPCPDCLTSTYISYSHASNQCFISHPDKWYAHSDRQSKRVGEYKIN